MPTNQTNQNPALLETLRAQTGFADSKANVLIGVDMAGLGFILSQVSNGPIVVRVLLGTVGLALAASLAFVLAVILPRSGSAGSWRSMWPASESEIIQMFAATGSDNNASNQCAKIVCRKYRCVQWAVISLAAAVLPAVGAIIASVAS